MIKLKCKQNFHQTQQHNNHQTSPRPSNAIFTSK